MVEVEGTGDVGSVRCRASRLERTEATANLKRRIVVPKPVQIGSRRFAIVYRDVGLVELVEVEVEGWKL